MADIVIQEGGYVMISVLIIIVLVALIILAEPFILPWISKAVGYVGSWFGR